MGAGPAGLTAAKLLSDRGISCQVFERDSQVGGLAKTLSYRGYRFDIGGHRFFTKVPWVQRFWEELLGDSFIRVPRMSRIYCDGVFFQYPLRPWDALKGLGPRQSVRVLASYLWVQLFPLPQEDFFEPYVINRFGRVMYRRFFKGYTEKVWGIPCSEIRAEWAAQRIKGLSLLSAGLKALGISKGEVKSLIESFHYPLGGPGMMWETVEKKVREAGNEVHLNCPVLRIQHDGGKVRALEVDTPEGKRIVAGTHFLSSIPLRDLVERLDPPVPAEIREAAGTLRYRDFLTVNLVLDRARLFPDNWIYVHSDRVRVARIQNYKNWSPAMVPDPQTTSLGMEYFCFEGDSLWKSRDEDLIRLAAQELETLGLAPKDEVVDGFVFRETKAYPMYNGDYRYFLKLIRGYLERFENFQAMGRNGLHRYNNQDHSMLCARYAVENLFGASHDLWEVNTDTDYQEEVGLPPARRELVGSTG